MKALSFTIPEILSLVGLAQCFYVLVYMGFRAGEVRRAILPVLYFFIVALGFFFDLGMRFIGDLTPYYPVLQTFFWLLGPSFGALLIIQIAQIRKVPSIINFWVLLLVPIAHIVSAFLTEQQEGCDQILDCMDVYQNWFTISGFFAGTIALLSIWFRRNILNEVYKQKEGKDRYWLILTLVFMNIAFLVVVLVSLSAHFKESDVFVVRNILGLGLVYLASTSLFRIYPQGLEMVERLNKQKQDLSPSETTIAKKIEDLLDLDKVYHDPLYSRSDLAQEIGTSEATVSKIINVYFKKSFPQILNERRVQDAQRLLEETDASIGVVSGEVGFNSTASFNRVFRDLSGMTPSAYRTSKKDPNKIG